MQAQKALHVEIGKDYPPIDDGRPLSLNDHALPQTAGF
jgi:hypothetical protein